MTMRIAVEIEEHFTFSERIHMYRNNLFPGMMPLDVMETHVPTYKKTGHFKK